MCPFISAVNMRLKIIRVNSGDFDSILNLPIIVLAILDEYDAYAPKHDLFRKLFIKNILLVHEHEMFHAF